MSTKDIGAEIKNAIEKETPFAEVITGIEFEGPKVAVYCRNLDLLMDEDGFIKKLAKKIQKRISLRPDPSILMDPKKARMKIKELVPDKANIRDVTFCPNIGEVVIEAEKPGVVIGKEGSLLGRITREVRWTPRAVRDPPIKSEIVRDIRRSMINEAKDRQKILRRIGKRIYQKAKPKGDWVRVSTLGGSQEVGRSANLLQTSGSKILLDCGINVASNKNAFPHLEAPEARLGELDAVVITHAHLDHSGFVPYLYKYDYDGPVYCTPPTRDLSTLLQLDYIDIADREGKTLPYNRKHVKKFIKHTIPLDYRNVTDISPDVRITFHNAGHILGSALTHFHIGEGIHNVLYTGDLKFDNTRLFAPADWEFPRLEALIMDSTYGGAGNMQPSRKGAEGKFLRMVSETLESGGKVLVPSFAVGRAQEIMVLLEESRRVGAFNGYPVYLDGMILEATGIHTAYPEYLSPALRSQILQRGRNPFLSNIFERVGGDEHREEIIDGDPCVIISTAGMMSGGPVLEYFKNLASDPVNLLVFVGYQCEGSLGRRIQKGWREVPMEEGGSKKVVEVNMNVETIEGFSGHSDRTQLLNYVRRVSPRPKHVICCHGDGNRCADLSSSLHRLFRIKTEAPQNLETIRLH